MRKKLIDWLAGAMSVTQHPLPSLTSEDNNNPDNLEAPYFR